MKIYCTKRSNSNLEKFVGEDVWVRASISDISSGWIQVYEITKSGLCKFRICPFDPEDFAELKLALEYGCTLDQLIARFRYGRIRSAKVKDITIAQPIEVLAGYELFGREK